jgi:hypothetical protein
MRATPYVFCRFARAGELYYTPVIFFCTFFVKNGAKKAKFLKKPEKTLDKLEKVC